MAGALDLFKPYQAGSVPGFGGLNHEDWPPDGPFDHPVGQPAVQRVAVRNRTAVLKAEDRTTMSHSIESRLPFLDYRLVGYLFSLPAE